MPTRQILKPALGYMIKPQYFFPLICCFILVAVLLVAFILIYMYLKNTKSQKEKKWVHMANLLIRKAIFFEETESEIPVTTRVQQTLSKAPFRKFLTEELLKAKKNVSGSASDNIKHLYLQLGLDSYALAGLKNYRWYIKAQAIQELSIIGLKEHLTKLYRLTNNVNDLVRMEAQVAVVNFYGFEGLRFLDVVSYPITEWQQIKLLQELSSISPDNFNGIEKWLKSSNKTVVIFALKLVRNYHRFELHNIVAECLNDPDDGVKLQAVITLGEIYDAETPAMLMSKFLTAGLKHKIAIIKVFQNIATDDEIAFLEDQLDHENVDIILQAARALAKIGASGIESLTSYKLAQQYPLNEIIGQVKNELAL
jgi:hypothetical protein